MSLSILYLEPFHTGSHAAFTRTLSSRIRAEWTSITLPGLHWKWRFRGAAPYLRLEHRAELERSHDLVFASSFLPLAELYGLVPALARTPSILYFHENQIAYPVQEERERDQHFAFTQLVSALAATKVVFNSEYNRASFLEGSAELLARLPDYVPRGWLDTIRGKSVVLGVPLDLPDIGREHLADPSPGERELGPVILWNHRWEHDKDPETFFQVLSELRSPFRVVVCGESFAEAPEVFRAARDALGDRVLHWGFAEARDEYHRLLRASDIVVSTAKQEFFGLAVMEAVHFGARPLVPDRLSYRELIPEEYRYRGREGLKVELEALCRRHALGEPLRADRRGITRPFGESLLEAYRELFEEVART